ncbi:FMN-dependent dehydrogenase [Aspergillus pseudodeflectus]|uniref:FMN-dependent dehydrogenase n=1 Tax=Aspergillus pseudodeflectus TaxID=176178 RepID=A0ABR4KVK0_9EURO
MANRNQTLDEKVYSIKDLEQLWLSQDGEIHQTRPEPNIFAEYYNEGAMDLITFASPHKLSQSISHCVNQAYSLHSNSSAYDRFVLRSRTVKFPFGFSPTAMQTLAHPKGDIATSKACNASNVLMGLLNYSTIKLEKVILGRENTPHVMQMSLLKNKAAMVQMIKGAEALFVTLDCPYLGRRLNEFRNRFSVPKGMEFPNLFPGVDVTNLEYGDERMAYGNTAYGSTHATQLNGPKLSPFFRQHTNVQIWAKGIYTSEDNLLAIKHGFNGLIVSNHGGRQLDGVLSSLDIPIAIDGGIRRGTDISKTLALGADFCLAGRIARFRTLRV